MTFQAARALYVVLAVGVVIASHLVVRTVWAYPDGRSRLALLAWFRAVRLYGVLVAVNIAANLWAGTTTPGLWASVLGAAYLLYALFRFLCTVRGWRL